jgi:beta-glucosidase
LQEWPPQHAQQPPASAYLSSSSSQQYSFDFSCDLLSDYDFLQQQQDFNWADPLLFPDTQDLTSLLPTCDTASTTVSPFAPSLPLSATPSPLLADTNDILSLSDIADIQQGWADPSPSAPPQPSMHLSLDHHLSSDDPYAAASLSHVTDTLSTTMGLTMPSGRNTMDMYRTSSSSGSSMGYHRDLSTTPPTSQQSSSTTSPTGPGQGAYYPGLTLASPPDASSKPKRGRPPGPKKQAKRALSPSAEAEQTDSEDVLIKRQRNNIAAKKYRQKKIDRIQELEEEVDQIKKEREELMLMLAKRDAEVGMLREMLAMAKGGR